MHCNRSGSAQEPTHQSSLRTPCVGSEAFLVAVHAGGVEAFRLLRKIQSSGNADARRPREEKGSVRLERLPDRASIKVALLRTMRDMVNHARPRRPDRWAARRRQRVHLGKDLPQRQGWTVRGVDEG